MDKAKILLVDDVKLSLEMGKMALANSGATIFTASNGREALEIVRKEHPGIVLSDVHMPEMNGDELCKAIKEDPSLKHIPFILFSGDKDIKDKYLSYGCDDVLIKPYQQSELLAMTRKYLSINARQHKRVKVNLELSCQANGKTVSGKVIDMSVGGMLVMLVESKESIPINKYTTFNVLIDGNSNGTTVTGKALWASKKGMGIQFLVTSNEIKSFLAEKENK